MNRPLTLWALSLGLLCLLFGCTKTADLGRDRAPDAGSMADSGADAGACANTKPCGAGGASCANTASSYACTCKPGYSAPATGGTCTVVNACLAGTDDCDTDPPACTSRGGGAFTCECPKEFSGKGVGASGCLFSDPSLLSLVSSAGTLTLTSATETFVLALPEGVASFTLTPTVKYPTHATTKVAGATVASGSASSPLTLDGFRPIDVVVTTDSGATRTYTVDVVPASTYVKASNTAPYNAFGWSVALSADGSTLAVGATTGFGGTTGEVYVFTRSGSTWSQQAELTASNADVGDQFGYSIALSADGSTLAVGANNESSKATGINGAQGDNSAIASGAVYVFTRSGTTWTEQAYVKASNTDAEDMFGCSVALSGDGATLAVGAHGESSKATGVDGDQTDNTDTSAGAVYVFTLSGTTWSQQAYLKASNTGEYDEFGYSVALASDGSTLAVGAWYESSKATGVDGDQTDNSLGNAGAVYVFTRPSTTWSQQAYVKASNTAFAENFGSSLALSSDGSTLAVGGPGDSSNASGINGDQTNTSDPYAGAVYVFTRSGAKWSQQAYVKASNPDTDDGFGLAVALSADGSTLAVSDIHESSNATGIDGDQTNNLASDSGAAYVFARSGTTWSQQAYVKPSNTSAQENFGWCVALSADASTLAVGATNDDSDATGIDGDQTNHSIHLAGAVFVF